MECQDCNKKEAEYIIFNIDDLLFFAVCSDCIKEEKDFVLRDTLIKKFNEVD